MIQPQPSPLGLSLWHFQSLLTPNPLHPLVIHPPTAVPEQRRYPAIPIPAVHTSRCNDLMPQSLLCLRHILKKSVF